MGNQAAAGKKSASRATVKHGATAEPTSLGGAPSAYFDFDPMAWDGDSASTVTDDDGFGRMTPGREDGLGDYDWAAGLEEPVQEFVETGEAPYAVMHPAAGGRRRREAPSPDNASVGSQSSMDDSHALTDREEAMLRALVGGRAPAADPSSAGLADDHLQEADVASVASSDSADDAASVASSDSADDAASQGSDSGGIHLRYDEATKTWVTSGDAAAADADADADADAAALGGLLATSCDYASLATPLFGGRGGGGGASGDDNDDGTAPGPPMDLSGFGGLLRAASYYDRLALPLFAK
jgi:hypothetical protein